MLPADRTKAALRTHVRAMLDALPPQVWADASIRICRHISTLDCFRAAKAIFAFVPIGGEVDITPLLTLSLSQGKVLCLPRIDWTTRTMVPAMVTAIDDTQLESTRHAIRQPQASCPVIPTSRLDLILVPGLAFAPGPKREAGFTRLGRGAGFYDRFFGMDASFAVGGLAPTTLGIALSQQILDSIPSDQWDVRVQSVATPDRVIGTV
jgi:5-formyltetrahydrofolate cyclo-ligase